MLVENDAVGGAGSFGGILDKTLDILTYGVKSTIDSRNARLYGIGEFSDTKSVNANGETRPSSAPATPKTFSASALELAKNPVVIGAAVLGIIGGIFLLLRK